ncbi:hypothetical protein O181_119829 [Austropuccinia psidii MF-1]|uniref:Uncharacterized protein n=1 Tax=Austropuccinia psidii MF-1 TaxID=1389203 RepID=A0A9Q3PZV0_9BASI|nr:hypothetical protein [Austropuccinia psidii MF-1]
MEDSTSSTSFQRLARKFDTLIASPEAEMTAIPVVRYEQFQTSSHRDIPVSAQELVYGRNKAGVGTSDKPLDRDNELLSSIEEDLRPKKYRGPSEGFDSNVFQRESSKKSILPEDKKKQLTQKKENSPVEAPQSSKSKNMPQKVPKKGKKF